MTPTETAGPYPSRADFVRSDIREDRQGTPLTLTITVVNANSACAAVAERRRRDLALRRRRRLLAVRHRRRRATFLRGIQTTNAAGQVTFTTIYPGWYQGRATHIHAEVTVNGRSVKVTQIAFPGERQQHRARQRRLRVARDATRRRTRRTASSPTACPPELVTPAGSPSSGYTAAFQIAVSV